MSGQRVPSGAAVRGGVGEVTSSRRGPIKVPLARPSAAFRARQTQVQLSPFLDVSPSHVCNFQHFPAHSPQTRRTCEVEH